jgi:DNA mismatch endonuclease (patch repair protein)
MRRRRKVSGDRQVLKEIRNQLMARVKSKNTIPEMAVRRAMHQRGFRYRLHRKDLPGCPDVVLPRHRTIVFIHGCFWHGCVSCDRGTRQPKSNIEFWNAKLASNKRRDSRNKVALEELGWRVLVVWECTVRDKHRLGAAIDELVRSSNFVCDEY